MCRAAAGGLCISKFPSCGLIAPSDNTFMSFDATVINPGRLRILTALACEPAQHFVELRKRTGLTDGNLATHARRLQSAGLVAIEKSFADGKPMTTFHLTRDGRQALHAHARELALALEPAVVPSSYPDEYPSPEAGAEDDWVD
jgi:DNA-binding MarR family transcriptional regulator